MDLIPYRNLRLIGHGIRKVYYLVDRYLSLPSNLSQLNSQLTTIMTVQFMIL